MVDINLEFVFENMICGFLAGKSLTVPRTGDYIDVFHIAEKMRENYNSLLRCEKYFLDTSCLENKEILVKKVAMEICSGTEVPDVYVFVEFVDKNRERLNPTSNWHNFNYSGKIK